MHHRTTGYRPPPQYRTIQRRPPPRRWPAGVMFIAMVPMIVLVAFTWRGLAGSGEDSAPPPASDGNVFSASPTAEAEAGPPPATAPAGAQRIQEPTAAPPTGAGEPAPDITASSAIVLDDRSLEVLYEKNARERRAPASLTKIATAIVTAEHADLSQMATSNVHYSDLEDSTAMALVPDDEVSMLDLLYGLMLVSGNDAAQVIAQHLAGTDDAFVVAMNLLIERLELTDTQFRNVHGLTEDGHYSTAYDLAILSRHLMGYPILREVVGTEQIVVEGIREGDPHEFDLYNHNPLLNYTDGVDGVKTGFTEEAGPTFAATVERDGNRVYIVLLNALERANDAIELIDWVYDEYTWPETTPPAATP